MLWPSVQYQHSKTRSNVQEPRQALSPYSQVLVDCETRDLAERTVGWGLANELFSSGEELGIDHDTSLRWTVVASVFARHCCPSGAPAASRDAAARFLSLFLHVDDAPPHMLGRLPRDGEWVGGELEPVWRAWSQEIVARCKCSGALVGNLQRSFRRCLAAIRHESTLEPLLLSLQEHWDIRRRTIFVDPYLDLWLVLLGFDDVDGVLAAFGEVRVQAVEIILLCNDLASLQRDRPGGLSPHDLNLVDTYARVRTTATDAAFEHMVTLHNVLVGRFRDTVDHLARASGGPEGEVYADLLTQVVDGHWKTLWALPDRYPGSSEVLRRLSLVRGGPATTRGGRTRDSA